ncbi:heat stress transcription factor B-4 [Abrus precatorius]|uniref:Heat stress transcription factor B-4 n=1 Tax=Abrus precatorius TaxID=3816 RepID=A0A8B8LJA4_ABRPR|nr:heat stress transcription factor B-4 [Abrus precatorius]
MALLLDNCEGILLSLDSHKSVPAPFLTKTYQLVDDPTTDHIVSWGEDDTTFVVWRPPEFARDLLPNYFKHNNFSSFVRQLNTYGFRKIVPDRWEFANEFFKKGEKHLLCEIHRRKTAQPQQGSMNHHHHHHQHHSHSPLGINVPSFFPFSTRVSISPSNESDEQANWCDSPPRGPSSVVNGVSNYNTSVTALSEDNERLRRSNNMLMSELAHMKKLYNDIIYFVQNHVKPVAPSNSYSSSFILCNTPQATPISSGNVSMMQRPMNQLLGYYSTNPKQATTHSQPQPQTYVVNSPTNTSRSSITIVEGPSSNSCKTKLFGVSLQSKKRVHPDYGSNNPTNSETNKARLVLEKDDLGLNLMPPSTC